MALDNPNPLLPKDGENTSSFKLAAVSAMAPVALGFVLVIGASLTPYAEVRSELIALLKYLVGAGIVGGAGVGIQYVRSRGAVSVAKLETYKAINAPAQTMPSASVTIEQTEGKS